MVGGPWSPTTSTTMDQITPTTSLTLLLVGTTTCNLACTYCYIDDASRARLTPEQFITIYDKLDAYFDPDVEFIIVFHGGEPLLLGKDFYRQAFDHLAKQSRSVKTAAQTNLTLMTPEWAQLFREAGCQIGTSVDGTQAMPDATRVHKDGRGSHREVLTRIRDVIRQGYSCSAITTLPRRDLRGPAELYGALRSYGATAV